MAARTSAVSASLTLARTSEVAGFVDSNVRPEAAGCHLPSMYSVPELVSGIAMRILRAELVPWSLVVLKDIELMQLWREAARRDGNSGRPGRGRSGPRDLK